MCIVGRKFGAGDRQITLGFRQVPASDYFQVGLWIADRSTRTSNGKAQLSFDQLIPVEASYQRGPTGVDGMPLTWIATKRSEVAALDNANLLHVEAGDFKASFKLRNIGGAMKAAAKCESDLLIGWGMDPTLLASIRSPATIRGGVVSLFGTNDYPSAALSRNEQGTSSVRFWVGVDGRVSDCKVVVSSGSTSLDAQTCAIILKRARFEPARTASGEPVASIVFQRMRWELP
jgi:TonB family protein